MPHPPNILFILSDQHGAAFTGCYGHPIVKTPNLDRLAARAGRFNRAYCASPLCVPSRMAFMTGQRVQDIGIWDNNTHLPSEARTLGHRLTAAGYEAVLCGRMHFNGEDKTHGFDRQIAEDPDANASIPDWGQGGGIAAATRPAGMTAAYSERMRKRPKVGSGERLDDIAEARAVEFLRARRDDPRPWALVVGLKHPHGPWNAEQQYWDLYDEADIDLPAPPAPSDQHPAHRRNRRLMRASDDAEPILEEAIVRKLRAGYYAVISRMDAKVGAILDALEAGGQADNTIIVYTSDHGEMLGEHNLWMKSTLFENAIRVPLLIAHPAATRTAGGCVDQNVSLLDLTATLCDWAGADTGGLHGRSVDGLLRGETDGWENRVLVEHYGTWTDRPLAAYIDGDFKLMVSHGEAPQLFNLRDDPGERDDLATRPEYADTLAAMERALQAQWPADALHARVLASQRQRLREEGT